MIKFETNMKKNTVWTIFNFAIWYFCDFYLKKNILITFFVIFDNL
jgi:hypothetical protein